MAVVLVASVSAYERRWVDLALEKTGWSLLHVEDAAEAARHLDGGAGAAVLVIDAGLLDTAHDAQWRVLRAHQPALGTVVRCLVSRGGRRQGRDGRTFLVHPDDVGGMREAIRVLGGPIYASS